MRYVLAIMLITIIAALVAMVKEARAEGHSGSFVIGEPPARSSTVFRSKVFSGDAERFFKANPVPTAGTDHDMVVRFTPSDKPGILGDIFFQNQLVSYMTTPDSFEFETEAGKVIVYINYGTGNKTEVISVLPPDGFIALQNDLEVGEEDAVTITIQEAVFG